MAVFDLFSKRQKRARGEMPDVYVYDELPQELRVQIVHIIRDAFGVDLSYSKYAAKLYERAKEILCREYGLFELAEYSRSDKESIFEFFLQVQSIERALDVVDLCFRIIKGPIAKDASYAHSVDTLIDPDNAVSELNQRFMEHGIGYQFESNELIRVDSQFMHVEAVKPTLAILRNECFKGANEEFLGAHAHYRHGRYKECLVDTLKAFESTMKTICSLRGWPIQSGDTAKNLIATCMENGLFQPYLQSQFASIRSLLESGIPTLRNRNGGHGQGTNQVEVPEYLARYALNLTATTILFMVEAHETTK